MAVDRRVECAPGKGQLGSFEVQFPWRKREMKTRGREDENSGDTHSCACLRRLHQHVWEASTLSRLERHPNAHRRSIAQMSPNVIVQGGSSLPTWVCTQAGRPSHSDFTKDIVG